MEEKFAIASYHKSNELNKDLKYLMLADIKMFAYLTNIMWVCFLS